LTLYITIGLGYNKILNICSALYNAIVHFDEETDGTLNLQ